MSWVVHLTTPASCAPDQVLEFYGLDGKNKWAQLGYESLFFLGFTTLAWAVSFLDTPPRTQV